MRALLTAVFCLTLALPATAQDASPVPERRLVLTENMDLVGADLVQIFDTTLDSCEAACLSNPACQAITFNARNGSCFPKSTVTGQVPYQGAYSGVVQAAAPGLIAQARQRAGDLAFLQAEDLRQARDQAAGLGRAHLTGDWGADQLLSAAAQSRRAGDIAGAARLTGAALNLTDAADQWLDYARLTLALPGDDEAHRDQAGRAVSAGVNGYLRAAPAALRAEALLVLAEALQRADRGRDSVPALRLAQSLSARDDIAAALADAADKYGFRITEHQVEADSAAPRICALFSEPLARAGTDYAPYVALPEPGLSVEPEGSQLCVAGLKHGARYALTFRAGLPADTGEALTRDVTITAYVRDRAPVVRFPGRAYILPRAADAGLPVETVNTSQLDLKLFRISDRNLVAAMRADYFARSLDYWSGADFTGSLAEEVWSGTAEVGQELNRDITTRLPVQEVTGPLGPGIYALQAALPGVDPSETPPALQWFVVSDLGLATLSGSDGLHVVVRGLSDAAPRTGAEVQLVSRANAVLGTARTDDQGHAMFDAGLAAGRGAAAPALVSVAMGEDIAFLSLTEPEFDLSDRGVAGLPPAPPIDVFVATDRGAYRAGETIHVTALARDSGARALSGVPLTAVLIRPDGVEHARTLADAVGAGGHVLTFPLAPGVPRGTWRLDILADPKAPPLASQRVLVEDFLPERIDFALTLPQGPFPAAALPELTLAARWLFGAPGAGLTAEADLRLSAAESVPGFEGFRFGRHDDPVSPWYEGLSAGQTDVTGALTIPVTLPDAMALPSPQPLAARVAVRLAEGSGRPVEREITRIVLPASPAPGIRPMFQGDTVAEGGEARFQIVALGPDGAPAAVPLHWRLNRVETDYQWYAMYGNWTWEPVTRRTRIAEGDLTATAGPAEIAAQVTWGRYELIVETTAGDYAVASVGFDAGWYAPADTLASPDRLELSLDKPAYRPGDTARLRLVPAADGVAVVSVLSNRVIALKTVAVTAGENLIDLPVTDDWGPGAYVTASVLRPLVAAAADRVPARALGLAHAAVDPGTRALAARFAVPAKSAPRAPLPVTLKVDGVAPGDTAFATIAAVDLGILNLTGFAAPDPQGHYFGQRRLGVALRDVYGRLIDGRTGAEGIIRSGGDGDRGLSMQAPPPTEELVAYFSGPLTIGADGTAQTEFQMPAFNGTVRLMAVVWSQGGVGQASADVLVRDPVVVTASAPRFLAPGDQARLMLDITHASGPAGRVGLDLTAEGLTLGASPSSVELAELGTARVTVPLTAGAAEGVETVLVRLTTPEGRVLDKVLTIPVQRNDPAISRQSRFDLAAGASFTLDAEVFAGLAPGTGTATLTLGPLARFDAAGLMAALDSYPYGCTEQTVSKALPLLHMSALAEPEGARPRIAAAVARVLTNQAASGAFGLWSPESGDLWLDAYVSDFLSRARAQGHAVPDAAFRNAMDNLRNQVNYAPDFSADTNGGGVGLAYALMVLAREGAAAAGDLRYYADVKGDDFATPLAAAQLGAALAAYGDQTRADAMFARAARLMGRAGDEGQIWRADYGTALRDQAAVLALAAEAGSTAVPLEAAGATLASRIAGQPLSPQEAAWALMAAQGLIDRPGTEGLTLNGAALARPTLQVTDAEAAAAPGAVANGSGKATTLTLTTTGVPEVAEAAGGTGYAITRRYYTLEGAAMDPAEVAQGTRLVTVLEVTPQGGGAARLMVADPLPAGFEIDNPNLLRGGDIAALAWLEVTDATRMTEFRQDRFLAALDWQSDDPFRLAYLVRAVTPGRFHHPAASVEDMYRPGYHARTGTGSVRVR